MGLNFKIIDSFLIGEVYLNVVSEKLYRSLIFDF